VTSRSPRRSPRARPLATRQRGLVPRGGAVIVLGLVLAGHGCAGPPWYLGDPLGGRPAIPPTSRAQTVAEHRRALGAAHDVGNRVTELAELRALEDRGALTSGEEKRLVELLTLRIRDWTALGRPIPLAEDLRHVIDLRPSRAQPLSARLRNAEIAAGDAWLGLGENARAEQEYRAAEKLGADVMDFRFRAVWGASVADLDDGTIERALAQLPVRVLGPFTVQYLDRGGAKPRLLRRSWLAARVFGPPALRARLEALPSPERFEAEPSKTNDRGAVEVAEGGKPPSSGLAAPPDSDLLFGGATLARALLPLAAAFPTLLAPGPRSRTWSERLIAEDPTSPDSFEVAALIDARAGRLGGAEQKLGELVFFSADRAAAYERAAHVWERVGQVRRACAAWDRATRVGAVDDPRWCDLLACVKQQPGAADPDVVADHIRARAPKLACVAVAPPATVESIDGGTADAPPLDAGPATPDGASTDGAHIDAGADTTDAPATPIPLDDGGAGPIAK